MDLACGYYNFFNVGAYGNGTAEVMRRGLTYAQNKGWNSVESSILGGSEYYKSQYIGRGQNTLYYQRFNVVYMPSLFSHQYQQDIMGAQTSATLLKNYYTTSGTISNIPHTFIIPLYENMPATACSRPSTTENQEMNLEEATVVADKVAVRAAPNSGRIISYLNRDEKVRILERANAVSADGNYWDVIVSNIDGTYGYVLRSEITKKNNFPTYVFDYKYYADTYKDLKNAYGYNETALYEHFIYYGASEGRSSSPVFNAKYYLENNGDLKTVYGEDCIAACNHFMNFAGSESRKSSAEYDGMFYKHFYLDLINFNSIQLIEHYMNYGRFEGRLATLDSIVESIVFDANVYADCNQDVVRMFGNDARELKIHWLIYGIKEGRKASLVYDSEIYGSLNTDLQKSFGNDYQALFSHFITKGIKEERTTSIFFDMSRYLNVNSDVKAMYGKDYKQIYLHFKVYGISEGREASDLFNVKTYVNSNSDLKSAFGTDYISAFIHFLKFGIHEKRTTSPIFDFNSYFSNYEDLRNAFGDQCKEYYMHYLIYGRAEGRKAI